MVVIPSTDGVDSHVLGLIDEHIARVRKAPRSADAHGNLGLVYEANDFWDEAARCFANAERLAPAVFVWSLHRAVAMKRASRMQDVAALLQQLAEAYPGVAVVQQRYGECLLETNDSREAGKVFERVIALAPRSALGYVGLGDVRMSQSRHQEAKGLLERAIVLDPGYKTAHYSLGLVYRVLGDRAAAQTELAKGTGAERRRMRDSLADRLDRFTRSLAGRLALAQRYKAAGRLAEAAEILEAAIATAPNEASVLNNLATIYMAQTRFDKAVPLLLSVQRSGDATSVTFTNLAACHLELNRLSEALAYARKAVERKPNDSQCHLAMASILVKAKRYEESLDALGTAAELDPGDPAPRLRQGRVYVLLERYEEARIQYAAAAELAPQSVTAYLNLAATSITVGRLDDAAAALGTAEMIEPNHQKVAYLKRMLAGMREP